MENKKTTRIGWEPAYRESFREDAHQLLAWGYLDAKPDITAEQEETEITGLITEAIRSRLDYLEDKDLPRFGRYYIGEDVPFSNESRIGKKRMRLDIVIESSNGKPRPRYVFEAKRLRKSSHEIGKYLGDEGLIRFIRDIYAPECPEVAMVGYVQTDAISHWAEKISHKFKKDSSGRFKVEAHLIKECIVSDLPDSWKSTHTRISGTDLTVFHLLLECQGANQTGS